MRVAALTTCPSTTLQERRLVSPRRLEEQLGLGRAVALQRLQAVADQRAFDLQAREQLLDRCAGNLAAAGLAPETPVQLLPGIAAYVGADITAGILATGMLYDEKPALLVDIGTNGEIVLQSGGKLFGCATAAGPAFEGGAIRCGMRAADGAIEVVKVDPRAEGDDPSAQRRPDVPQAHGQQGEDRDQPEIQAKLREAALQDEARRIREV